MNAISVCLLWQDTVPKSNLILQKKMFITVNVYGETRTFLIKGFIALWYRVAKSRPLYILIVRDPTLENDDEFLFTNDLSLLPEIILELIAGRWSIEVTHRDSKQYIGVSDPLIRNPKSVKRQNPFWLSNYEPCHSLVCRAWL